jgi:hypothetical protein
MTAGQGALEFGGERQGFAVTARADVTELLPAPAGAARGRGRTRRARGAPGRDRAHVPAGADVARAAAGTAGLAEARTMA